MENIFATRLRIATANKGVRPATVARACHVSRAAVSIWLRGSSAPQGPNLRALARFLDVRPDWLAGHDDDVTPPHHRKSRASLALVRDNTPPTTASYLDGFAGAIAGDMKGALMTLQHDFMELAQAWLALPENERDAWKQRIVIAASKYRRTPESTVALLHTPADSAARKRRRDK